MGLSVVLSQESIMALSDEMALVKKLISLDQPCKTIFDGLTSRDERRDKVRAAIQKIPDVTYTIQSGKRITLAMAFARAYGETL
jgi:hypothetical protein